MSRFYVPKEAVRGNQILISGKEAHHSLGVMRHKVSDEVTVFDGTGKEYTGVVTQTRPGLLTLEIIKTRHIAREEKYSITLIQAIPKKNKMDYIVEKATELGVIGVIPVTTARTIPCWSDSKKAAISARWQKIAREAAKQCGRADLPEVKPVINIEEALKDTGGYDLKLMAALNNKAVKLKDALKNCPGGKIVIAIGPEGDFTSAEVKKAERHGFRIVNLGPRVLKSDTAALAVLAMINYEYQN
jgi:16S rRNA (uracil1498-N3)-methyltransferase